MLASFKTHPYILVCSKNYYGVRSILTAISQALMLMTWYSCDTPMDIKNRIVISKDPRIDGKSGAAVFWQPIVCQEVSIGGVPWEVDRWFFQARLFSYSTMCFG